jgi:hypothetical protein
MRRQNETLIAPPDIVASGRNAFLFGRREYLHGNIGLGQSQRTGALDMAGIRHRCAQFQRRFPRTWQYGIDKEQEKYMPVSSSSAALRRRSPRKRSMRWRRGWRHVDLYYVRWIRSYWSADRRRMICEYDVADVARVRRVQREADAKFDRAWAADVLCGMLETTWRSKTYR